MAKISAETKHDREEAKFPYSHELVANIAAQFAADGNVSDIAAVERAIKLLDTVQSIIKSKRRCSVIEN